MAFTAEQQRAIDAKGRVIVSASAGSGKTTVMIEKIIRLILSGVDVDQILAVTFTKKAAAQMKEKLCRALIGKINETEDKELRAALKRQLAGVPNADISTIHSYCSKLIKGHFYAAEVDGDFRVIGGDDADGTALKNAALDELLEEGYEKQEEEFLHLLSCYWRKKTDNALRKLLLKTYEALRDKADYREFLQRNRAGYTEAEFDSACEETRKLFAEKCRYYYELVEDERGFFLDIAEVSAKQLALCDELMAWLEACANAKSYFEAAAIPKPVLTNKSTSSKDTAEKLFHVERLAFLRTRIVKTLEAEFKDLGSREEELAYFLASGRTAAALAKYLLLFDERYGELKREKGVLDYNDLEHKALALLKLPEIAREIHEKYSYVFVDEYQDVNPVQEEIISALSSENLFLVGDVKQSIYGFRGSKSKFFVQKQEEFANGSGQALFMSKNFRSEDKVLDAVNAQFSLAMTKRVCSIDYARDSVMEKGGRYLANGGSVKIHFAEKEKKKPLSPRGVYSVIENAKQKEKNASPTAKLMAQLIKEELQGYLDDPATNGKRPVRCSDIAILMRKTSKEIVEEVEALSELGFPITTASTVNICDFSEVKALIDILSLLDNAEQDIPLCSALLSGMGKLTADDLAEIRLRYKGIPFRTACKSYAREEKDGLAEKLQSFYRYFDRLRVEACVLSAGEVLAKILADTQMEAGLLSRKNGVGCLKRIRRFVEEAGSFDGDSVHEFLEYLRNLNYDIPYSENGGEDSIKVMTMHSSKGLEFPIVMLANLNDGFGRSETPEAYVVEGYGLAPRAFNYEKMLKNGTILRRLFERREEHSSRADELNLYYVALTRAEQKLHLIFNERLPMPDVKYAKSYAEFTDFSAWEEYVEEDFVTDLDKAERQPLLLRANEAGVEEILRAHDWQYSHTGYENLPVKSSPTQLMDGGKYQPVVRFKACGKEEEEDEVEEDRGLAVRAGTAYHAFLEYFDFANLREGGTPVSRGRLAELVEDTLASLQASEVEVRLLEKERLVDILSNPVFYELEGMRLYKEQQFLVSLPIKDTYAKKTELADTFQGKEEGEEMLFQGAIDLLAVGEEVRVIDYKFSDRGAEELKAHYAPQLKLYKLATAKTLKIEPDRIRCSIVNIKRGFQVDVE